MIPLQQELALTQTWAANRRNTEYQRAFNETMAVLLAGPEPIETILSILSRPRVAQKNEGTNNAV